MTWKKQTPAWKWHVEILRSYIEDQVVSYTRLADRRTAKATPKKLTRPEREPAALYAGTAGVALAVPELPETVLVVAGWKTNDGVGLEVRRAATPVTRGVEAG